MKVVLFDIDGTLLRSGGAGRGSMERALRKTFGTTGDPAYHYDGKTDRQIVRDLMRAAGNSDEHIDERMSELLDDYLTGLNAELETRADMVLVYPGVEAILDALECEPGIVLGLLTGNIERGAHAKLTAAGLDLSRFKINAFGSDHEHRPELPAIAQRRASESLGLHIAGDRLVVIGDTPADIQCGRSVGARAIGVATGRYTVAELEAHDPYAVFGDLSDTGKVLQTILDA